MSPCATTVDGTLTICRPSAPQPMTRYATVVTLDMDPAHDRTFRSRNHPRRQFWCHKCRRRRWAKNLVIISDGWYDPMIFCAGGCPRRRRAR